MEKEENMAGFSKKEGITALFCYFGFFIAAFLGLRKRPAYLIVFLILTAIFHTLFAKRLCSICTKICPGNPTGNFWKIYFKRME
jgi:hypothetical protein